MIILQWILFIFSWLFFIAGAFVIFSCFVGLLKYKDFFIRVHAVKISNIYGISFILFASGLTSGDMLIFLQLFLIIILNILITITITHSICRIALSNNITHGGFSRRKYNELLSQKEKEEAEQRMRERIKMEQEKIKRKAAAATNAAKPAGGTPPPKA